VSHPPPPQQAEVLGHRPLLRRLPPVPARPVGLRRPRQRRLPAQVRLDDDRPAPDGQGHRITRRPRPRPVLDRPATQETTGAAEHDRPASAQDPGRPLSTVHRPPATRRPATTNPTTMGTVAPHRPDNSRPHPGPQTGRPYAGRHPPPPRAHLLPTPTTQAGPSNCQPASPRGLLEPCAVNAASTVLRGPRRGNAPGLPDFWR
jgi:hypothetical protein